MKAILAIIFVLLFSCNSDRYKENINFKEQPLIFDSVIQNDSTLVIGINGSVVIFRDTIPKKDSTHYFFTQYIKFKNRGIKDSLNPYYFKLLKK